MLFLGVTHFKFKDKYHNFIKMHIGGIYLKRNKGTVNNDFEENIG